MVGRGLDTISTLRRAVFRVRVIVAKLPFFFFFLKACDLLDCSLILDDFVGQFRLFPE